MVVVVGPGGEGGAVVVVVGPGGDGGSGVEPPHAVGAAFEAIHQLSMEVL